MTPAVVRDALPVDLEACLSVYNDAVRTLLATFDTAERGAEHFEGRIGAPDPLRASHTQLAVIALPNPASEALHRRCGFEPVGTMRQVGRKFDKWVDTAWYQRLSPVATS